MTIKESPKNSPQNSTKFLKNSQKNPKSPKKSQNIQFPTLHLETENPFGLVYNLFEDIKFLKIEFILMKYQFSVLIDFLLLLVRFIVFLMPIKQDQLLSSHAKVLGFFVIFISDKSLFASKQMTFLNK